MSSAINPTAVPLPTQGIAATWFDGTSARRTDVRLILVGRTVQVLDLEGRTVAHVPRDLVRAGDRIGDAPYRIEFPNGALAVSAEHRAIERAFRLSPGTHWLAKMEQAWWAVLLAMVGLAVAIALAYLKLLPVVAEWVAQRIPMSAEKNLGDISLRSMDQWMLKPSKLSAVERETTQRAFDRLSLAAGLSEQATMQHRAMMPNALALPGGTIIVTDGLVKLFQGKEPMIAAVLAHELGHVHGRHSMRHLIAGSASALIVGALAGDVSGISALATTAPVVLSTLHYTRSMEREADEYAFALLTKAGYSPKDFADAMRRFEQMELCVALRAQDQDTKPRYPKSSASDEYDAVSQDDAAAPTANDDSGGTKTVDSERAASAKCFSEPEAYLAGRDNDIALLRLTIEDRETGYMHSHPITQERIRAAEAAAKGVVRP